MGDVHLDLTSVVCAESEVELRLTSLMGDVEVVLPDGVEVELTGFDVMGDRDLVLAPVPRVPGTPLIRVRAHAVMGDVLVRSSSAPRGSAPGLAALARRGARRAARPERDLAMTRRSSPRPDDVQV